MRLAEPWGLAWLVVACPASAWIADSYPLFPGLRSAVAAPR